MIVQFRIPCVSIDTNKASNPALINQKLGHLRRNIHILWGHVKQNIVVLGMPNAKV